jgi:hypothetical protein
MALIAQVDNPRLVQAIEEFEETADTQIETAGSLNIFGGTGVIGYLCSIKK